MMEIVEVKFNNNSCAYFRNNGLNLKLNITVIVDTERGYQFGKVINIFDDISRFEKLDLFDVVRVSKKQDYYHYLENVKLEEEALNKCRELVIEEGLTMSILDASYNFDRSVLLFRFVAEERIDFRKLARDLGGLFHARIELRQIGIRDKAKEIGGIGPCGRLLCCSSFLNSFDSVTINMAKNQNVSLNPSKINGVCGRLLCCLKYENDVYSSLKMEMPKVGSRVEIDDKNGKVVSLNALKGEYTVEFEDKSRIDVNLNEGKE